jgi:hypothetical protein
MPLQHQVDVAEDHSGACLHPSAAIPHFAALPVTVYIDQNVVGLQLTVETRARRPKRRVPSGFTAITEKLYDVIGRSRQHDDLRDESIQACIGGMLDTACDDFNYMKLVSHADMSGAGHGVICYEWKRCSILSACQPTHFKFTLEELCPELLRRN